MIQFWIWFLYSIGLLIYVGVYKLNKNPITFNELKWFMFGVLFVLLSKF